MFFEVGYPTPKRFDLFIQTGETIGKNLVEIAARRCFLTSPAGTFPQLRLQSLHLASQAPHVRTHVPGTLYWRRGLDANGLRSFGRRGAFLRAYNLLRGAGALPSDLFFMCRHCDCSSSLLTLRPYPSLIGKAEVLAVSDDNVIQNPYPDQFPYRDEAFRQGAIFGARVGIAARMIVHKDDGGG